MTLLEVSPESLRENCSPVLETERLVLRAPRFEDAKSVAALANDRRIAENTRRIPDRKSTRLNSSHRSLSRMPSSA